MNTHSSHANFKLKMVDVLNSTKNPKCLLNQLSMIYREIKQLIPHSNEVNLELIETESLRYSVFYQSSNKLSKHALYIHQLNYHKHLWTDQFEWNLEDDYFDIDEIAQELVNIPAVLSIPENTKDLLKLIKNGLWSLSTDNLPSFNPNPPEDTDEVLSWDDTHVLIGKTKENLEVVTRKYWDELCKRESHWFKEQN